MEWVLWIGGLLFLLILVIWWKAFLILFAVTVVAALITVGFFIWRVSVLKSAPGVFEIEERKDEFHCVVHPSALGRAGLLAIHFPALAYLLACVCFSGYVLTSQFDFLTLIGCIMFFPPVFLVMKYSPKLEWFVRNPLERYAKKLTTGLRIPEYLIQSDLAGRGMAKALSGQWQPNFSKRYFQRLEMQPDLMLSEPLQLKVMEEFKDVGMQDLHLLSMAEDHWQKVNGIVSIVAQTGTALKDDAMKKDAAFLAKSLRNPELSDLLEFRQYGEFFDVLVAIQKDAEDMLKGKLPEPDRKDQVVAAVEDEPVDSA